MAIHFQETWFYVYGFMFLEVVHAIARDGLLVS